MNDERRKILDKIRKLLAMADDVGSPHEAATAARMAKKAMDKYNVTHAEALATSFGADDFDAQLHGDAYAAFPKHLSVLACGIADYTDCRARFDWTPGYAKSGRPKMLKQIRFEGELTDLEVCKYLYTYLARTIDRLVKESPHNKYIGPRTSFRKACVSEIVDRLRAMKREEREQFRQDSNSKALVLVDRKKVMLDQKFGTVKYSRRRSTISSGAGYADGRAAGAGIGIRKAVNTGAGVKRLGK